MVYQKKRDTFAKHRVRGNTAEGGEEVIRVRLPRDKETFGIVEQRLGGNRMRVRCMDSNTRVCRVPGRLRKRLWVREGDILLIQPWAFGGDEKGDVIYKYKFNQIDWLRKHGKLDQLEEFEEF